MTNRNTNCIFIDHQTYDRYKNSRLYFFVKIGTEKFYTSNQLKVLIKNLNIVNKVFCIKGWRDLYPGDEVYTWHLLFSDSDDALLFKLTYS